MDRALQSTATSLQALVTNYEVTASNLANINTTGYKRRVGCFAAALAQLMGQPVPMPTRTSLAEIACDFSQGPLVHSGRNLDLAIRGMGFFALQSPDGPVYTRNGVFQQNPRRQLVSNDNYPVLGDGGPITIPEGTATIAVQPDGKVLADGALLARLRVVDFDDPAELRPLGKSMFHAGGATPSAAKDIEVLQGYREGSNVSMVDELVAMIAGLRLYQANLRSVEALDQRSKQLLNLALM